MNSLHLNSLNESASSPITRPSNVCDLQFFLPAHLSIITHPSGCRLPIVLYITTDDQDSLDALGKGMQWDPKAGRAILLKMRKTYTDYWKGLVKGLCDLWSATEPSQRGGERGVWSVGNIIQPNKRKSRNHNRYSNLTDLPPHLASAQLACCHRYTIGLLPACF